jgi:hypothetical protein
LLFFLSLLSLIHSFCLDLLTELWSHSWSLSYLGAPAMRVSC